MKKFLFILVAALVVACDPAVTMGDLEGYEDEDDDSIEVVSPAKKFTFTIKGDFAAPTFSRGYLQADGKEMTDLWVFDYVDGVCVQKLHQSATDESWGKPQLRLSLGAHSIKFVASRGSDPIVDEENHVIKWSSVKDTFWANYEVDVKSSSNGNRAVTLGRVVTKLKATVDDKIVSACKHIVITPSVWYYGIDYVSGAVAAQDSKSITIDVPSSYVGTEGSLSASVFSVSGAKEWTSDVVITATDADGMAIGAATIKAVPLKSNRATEYDGCLFSAGEGDDVSLATQWDAPVTGTW